MVRAITCAHSGWCLSSEGERKLCRTRNPGGRGDVFFSRYSQRLVKHHLFMLIIDNLHKFVRDGNYCSCSREMKIEILRGEVTSQLITSLGF